MCHTGGNHIGVFIPRNCNPFFNFSLSHSLSNKSFDSLLLEHLWAAEKGDVEQARNSCISLMVPMLTTNLRSGHLYICHFLFSLHNHNSSA